MMSLSFTAPAVSSPNSPCGEHVSPSMSADFEQWSSSVVHAANTETPALYAPPQKRRRTLPSSAVSGVCVEHRRREPQGSRHTSLSDSVDSLSTRTSDCDSLADLDDVAVPFFRPSARISLDDFTLDGEAVPDYELVPGVTYEEAELDALLRALSPAPEVPVALPPLSTSNALPPSSDSCANSMLAQSVQPQNSGSQVVSLPSPEQRIPAFYDVSEDVVMNEVSEFAQPLPSPLQFSAAGSAAASPEQSTMPDTIDPRALGESLLLPRLTITVQPGPRSFLKSSAEPPVFTVTLQCGQHLSAVSRVRAVCADWVKLPCIDAELNKDNQANVSILFPNATPALRPIRVSFEVDVETPSGPCTIRSEPSQPITLRTNISQFMKAERVVLMDNIFPEATSAFEHWDPVVANGFHQHFNAWAGTRGFAGSDFDFLRTRFTTQPLIQREAVEDLFERWYGPMVKHFTDKNFRKLWQLRIIYGFVTQANASSTLSDIARQVGPAFSGITLAAFMDGSPFLTIASLTPEGGTHFRQLSQNELKKPFRDIIAEMPNVNFLVLRAESDTFQLHSKKDVVAMLLPKKMHQRLAM